MSDHAPSVAAPISLREAQINEIGELIAVGLLSRPNAGGLTANEAHDIGKHVARALRPSTLAALRAESVAAPATTRRRMDDDPGYFPSTDYEAGYADGPAALAAVPPALDAAHVHEIIDEVLVRGRQKRPATSDTFVILGTDGKPYNVPEAAIHAIEGVTANRIEKALRAATPASRGAEQ